MIEVESSVIVFSFDVSTFVVIILSRSILGMMKSDYFIDKSVLENDTDELLMAPDFLSIELLLVSKLVLLNKRYFYLVPNSPFYCQTNLTNSSIEYRDVI